VGPGILHVHRDEGKYAEKSAVDWACLKPETFGSEVQHCTLRPADPHSDGNLKWEKFNKDFVLIHTNFVC
jgi:hypothetical protein